MERLSLPSLSLLSRGCVLDEASQPTDGRQQTLAASTAFLSLTRLRGGGAGAEGAGPLSLLPPLVALAVSVILKQVSQPCTRGWQPQHMGEATERQDRAS